MKSKVNKKSAVLEVTTPENKQNTNYERISNNIYKTKTSYRVRVNGVSQYVKTKAMAFKVRKHLMSNTPA